MARRRKRHSNSSEGAAAFVGITVLLLIFITLLANKNFGVIMLGFGFIGLLLLVVFILMPKWRRDELFQRADVITSHHLEALMRQRTIMVRTDAYGKPLLDKWNTEINYFITHHIRPGLQASQCCLLEKHRQSLATHIAQRVENAAQQRAAPSSLPANMTGAEFEAFCADRLRACGWEVRLTPLCRDQGVDVIAEKNRVRVALQCKLYANPVGNKAVQEIAAGRVHEQAHYG